MTGIDFVPVVALGLVIYTVTNLYKYLTNRQWNAAITLLVGWLTGAGAVWLVGQSSWGDTVGVGGDVTLSNLSGADVFLVGLVVVSTASTVFDFKKAFDRSDSAAVPSLLPEATSSPPQEK